MEDLTYFPANIGDPVPIHAFENLSAYRRLQMAEFLRNLEKEFFSYNAHEKNLLYRAFVLCFWLHSANPDKNARGRKTGEPYSIHPLEVALKLMVHNDQPIIADVAAGFVHDTMEDTSITYHELSCLTNPQTARLVDYVTKVTETVHAHLTLAALKKFLNDNQQTDLMKSIDWQVDEHEINHRQDVPRMSDLCQPSQDNLLAWLTQQKHDVYQVLTNYQLLSCLESRYLMDFAALNIKLVEMLSIILLHLMFMKIQKKFPERLQQLTNFIIL